MIIGYRIKLDTIDKVIEKLKELTEGYKVVTAGSSAGGYMAVVAGIQMKAEKILCFSGQFCLESSQKNGIVRAYENDPTRNKYFDTTKLIEQTDVPIIYFYPIKSEADKRQAERVNSFDNIIPFAFDYAAHAQTVVPYNYKYLFGISAEKYRKLSRKLEKKRVKAVYFLIRTGKMEGIIDCFRGVFALIKKKLSKHR